MQPKLNRRTFVHKTFLGAAGAGIISHLPLTTLAGTTADDNINIIGPVEGYSPQIGILVSMLNWIRDSVIRASANLTQEQLDFQLDDKSNSIAALLSHMAATDVIYQDLTFYGQKKGFSEDNAKKYGVAMSLGEEARKQIKGHPLEYYLNDLKQVREKTLSEFKKRDDKWFAEVDPAFFGRKPTNNFCKWFHVCEHEANHRGQIATIKKRFPGNEHDNG